MGKVLASNHTLMLQVLLSNTRIVRVNHLTKHNVIHGGHFFHAKEEITGLVKVRVTTLQIGYRTMYRVHLMPANDMIMHTERYV